MFRVLYAHVFEDGLYSRDKESAIIHQMMSDILCQQQWTKRDSEKGLLIAWYFKNEE